MLPATPRRARGSDCVTREAQGLGDEGIKKGIKCMVSGFTRANGNAVFLDRGGGLIEVRKRGRRH